MITFHVSADVTEDRQLVVTLPPEVPPGNVELVVVVQPGNNEVRKRPRSSLADWAEANAEHWGEQIRSDNAGGQLLVINDAAVIRDADGRAVARRNARL